MPGATPRPCRRTAAASPICPRVRTKSARRGARPRARRAPAHLEPRLHSPEVVARRQSDLGGHVEAPGSLRRDDLRRDARARHSTGKPGRTRSSSSPTAEPSPLRTRVSRWRASASSSTRVAPVSRAGSTAARSVRPSSALPAIAGWPVARQTVADVSEVLYLPLDGSPPSRAGDSDLAPSAGFSISADGRRVALVDREQQERAPRPERGCARREGARDEGDLRGTPLGRHSSPRAARRERVAVRVAPPSVARSLARDAGRGAARAIAPGITVDSAPAVSADGKRVAIGRVGGGISVAPLGGGAVLELTRDPNDAGPTFARDGRRIYFERRAGVDARSIRCVPVDGGPGRSRPRRERGRARGFADGRHPLLSRSRPSRGRTRRASSISPAGRPDRSPTARRRATWPFEARPTVAASLPTPPTA